MDPTTGEVGYWAHPAVRGRGMISEAVRLVPPTPSVRRGGRARAAAARPQGRGGNGASQHVAESNGFQRTGKQRQAERLGDGYDDLVDFDLLATDEG